ncbi:MAG: phosphoglycerate kinase [Rhodospirillaceae bacterium]|nr:phosphoglycerate kinase [Rhodospirillaceae bacterium]
MAQFRTLDDIDVTGRRVLVRSDLNVPMKNGRVTDTTRIDRSAVTIQALIDKGASVVVLSHFDRPGGKRVPEMSLAPVVEPLSAALSGRPVAFADDCIGPAAERAVAALKPGSVLLLENLRFHAGEEMNDPGFARALAASGEIYVNDAFSAAHRAHASTEAIARLLPAVAGRLMEAELDHLSRALDQPQRPVAAIVGGAKISTKLDLLGNLVAKMDLLIVGGGMANTFLHASGIAIGRSLAERDMAARTKEIMQEAQRQGCDILLPEDAVVAKTLAAGVETETVAIQVVPADQMILDIGPATVASIERRLDACRTLVWNGPLGAFETPPFDAGTMAVAEFVAKRTQAARLMSVAGGGDTVAALAKAGVTGALSYVSTAGGAFLEWLEGKTLPGVKALEDAAR